MYVRPFPSGHGICLPRLFAPELSCKFGSSAEKFAFAKACLAESKVYGGGMCPRYCSFDMRFAPIACPWTGAPGGPSLSDGMGLTDDITGVAASLLPGEP